MTRDVQAPPNTTPLTESMDREHDALLRDAAAFRAIGAAGWTLVRTSELEELNRMLAEMLETFQAKEVVPTATPSTPNTETAERR